SSSRAEATRKYFCTRRWISTPATAPRCGHRHHRSRRMGRRRTLVPHRPMAAESFKNHAVVAFAGIAKPERFFGSLESLGIHPTKRVRFRDHHRYCFNDIESLDGEMLITTEKDAVRLR